jgi:hypothetical protein
MASIPNCHLGCDFAGSSADTPDGIMMLSLLRNIRSFYDSIISRNARSFCKTTVHSTAVGVGL